jgi:hypothetical protein
MKQSYTLYIYRSDKRTKSGERVVRTQVCTDQDDAGMQNLVDQLIALYPAQSRYRFEWFPTMITVKNLMTGKDVQIDRDTPWCCNPASESFWSN